MGFDTKSVIENGKAVLGIEFGSTRIKAVLIGENNEPIASGAHDWENRLENNIWTYTLEDIWTGLQDSYKKMTEDVKEKYGVEVKKLAALGFSAMMHGYMAFNESDELLVPFRTWRNTMTQQASDELTELFQFNIPQRWSIAHLYQAMLNKEEHVSKIKFQVSGPDQVGAGGSASFTASPIFMEDEGNYQWMVSPNTASMSAYRYSNSVTFSAPGTYIVGCRSTSTCGTPGSYVIKTVSVTGYYYSVSTSSSTHMVNISKETQIQDQFSVMLETRPTYTLYNQSTGALVREGTFLREGDLLDFNTLPSGIYVLRLQIGNDTYETHKIVFK